MIAGLIVCGLAGVALLLYTPGNSSGGSHPSAVTTTAPLGLGTTADGAAPAADDAGTSSAEGTSAKLREYCSQAGALNDIAPLLRVYYSAKELDQFKTTTSQFEKQLAYLSRIAPPDVAAPTQAYLMASVALNSAVQKAKTLADVTTYFQQNFQHFLTQALPWLSWTKANCPTLSSTSEAQ